MPSCEAFRPRESQVKRCRWPGYALDPNSSASNHKILLQQQIQFKYLQTCYRKHHLTLIQSWRPEMSFPGFCLLSILSFDSPLLFPATVSSLQGGEMGISIFISIFIFNILDCALLMKLLSMGQSANAPSTLMCSSLDESFLLLAGMSVGREKTQLRSLSVCVHSLLLPSSIHGNLGMLPCHALWASVFTFVKIKLIHISLYYCKD